MSLQIPIGEIYKQTSGTVLEGAITDFEDLKWVDFTLLPKQTLPYQIIRIPNGVVAVIDHSSLAVTTKCGRCLKEYQQIIQIDNKERIYYFSLAEDMEDEDDYELVDLKNCAINLHDFIYEEIALALPDRLICQEDCPGLSGQTQQPKTAQSDNPFKNISF